MGNIQSRRGSVWVVLCEPSRRLSMSDGFAACLQAGGAAAAQSAESDSANSDYK